MSGNDRPQTTATAILEREQAERNEAPQVVAHRAYTESLVRIESDSWDVGGPDGREEIALRSAISALQRHYQLQAEPWIKRLGAIEARKPIVIPRFLDGTYKL